MKLITHTIDGNKRKLREFIENVDIVFELADPSKHDLLKFLKAKVTRNARSNLMIRDLTHSWELVRATLEENCATRCALDYYACKLSCARQGKNAYSFMGNKIDELKKHLREDARCVFKPEEILGAKGMTNHQRKACFTQELYRERKLSFGVEENRSSCLRKMSHWKKVLSLQPMSTREGVTSVISWAIRSIDAQIPIDSRSPM